MNIFTKEFKDLTKEVFISGHAEMSAVWLLFLLGLVLGWNLHG